MHLQEAASSLLLYRVSKTNFAPLLFVNRAALHDELDAA